MEKQRLADNLAPADRKKPYRKPRLIEYGDLQKITMAKAGNMDDGSLPATRK
jgi:hypothetical protein